MDGYRRKPGICHGYRRKPGICHKIHFIWNHANILRNFFPAVTFYLWNGSGSYATIYGTSKTWQGIMLISKKETFLPLRHTETGNFPQMHSFHQRQRALIEGCRPTASSSPIIQCYSSRLENARRYCELALFILLALPSSILS